MLRFQRARYVGGGEGGEDKRLQQVDQQLEQARNDLAQAQRKGDYAEAGRLTYGVIPDLEKKLAAVEEQSGAALVDEAVTPDHVAQVVSRWTGVPVDKMLEGERDKLLKMENPQNPVATITKLVSVRK